MNAAIRAVVRTGIYHHLNVYGVMYGYKGMLTGRSFPWKANLSPISSSAGHRSQNCPLHGILPARRPQESIREPEEIRDRRARGDRGDGSFKGAQKFSEEFDIPCIGLPGTIDKDIAGTDFTIGFDTAVNTAVEAIDKIRDTADAHDRLFIIEVMGRDAGYIALHSGIATGAEHILIPERKTNIDDVIDDLTANERRAKMVNLIVVAEGDEFGGADEVARHVKERMPQLDTRVTVLGHIQRGGSLPASTVSWPAAWATPP